ncbi:MAG: sulfur carrier protein ThiS [Nitrospirota bacterium]|jgi:sulfur carrier protein
MKIKVNGEEIETAAETLEGLIGECRLEPQGVAVEVNLNIVRKTEYGAFRLKEGDVVEIVSFVGGG